MALLVTGFSGALPPVSASASPAGTSDSHTAAAPTPPPEFNCIGFGAALAVISPSHPVTVTAAGIVGNVFELEGSGYYNRTSGPMGNFTIWMANYSGGSLLYLALVPAGSAVDFFVNVTVPSTNGTAAFPVGPYEFWSVENYTTVPTCANAAFDLNAAPPPTLGCLFWTAQLLVTSPDPANGTAGSPVEIQGRAFSTTGYTTVYWANAAGSPDASVGTTATTTPNGWFNRSIDVPSAYAPGLYVFWAIDGYSDCAGAVFNLTAGPTIVLAPATGPGGISVTVTGAGFSSADTSITISGAVLLFSLPCTLTGGSITGNCAFQVDGGLAGPHTITGVGNVVGGLTDTAYATFTLFPTITLSPSSGLVGSSFTTSGVDFSAGPAAADVTFDGVLLTPSGGSDCGAGSSDTLITPDPEGSFVCTFTAPTWTVAGTNYVQGDDTSTGELTAVRTFTSGSAVTITSTPTTGPVGTPVRVAGSGWTPSDYVLLGVGPVGDDYSTAGVFCAGTSGGEPTVNATGGFTCSFDFPAVGPGVYAVLATDATAVTDPITIVYSTNTFTVGSVVTITSTPTACPVGTAVTVAGLGWTPSDYVLLGVGPVGDDYSTVGVFCTGTSGGEPTVNATGGFACSFDFPPVGIGVYSVLATDATEITDPITIVYSTNTFTVGSVVTITSTPTTGPVGTAVTVTGLGWTPSDYVLLGVGPVGDDYTTAALYCSGTSGGEPTVNATGGFVCSVDFPMAGAGFYSVLATDATEITDPITIVYSTNTFTVTTPHVLSVSSTNGAPGPITFSVTGLAPNTVYDVYLDAIQGVASAASYNPIGTCTSSAGGSLTGCKVTIPTGLSTGKYYVDLFQDPLPPPYIVSVFNFTVTSAAPHPSLLGLSTLDYEILGGIAVLAMIGVGVAVARRGGKPKGTSSGTVASTKPK